MMTKLMVFDEICKFGHQLYFACNEKGDKVCPDPVCKLCAREYKREQIIKNNELIDEYIEK